MNTHSSDYTSSESAILAFDIGGTWTRFGADRAHGCELLDKLPTPSFARGETSKRTGQARLIELMSDCLAGFLSDNPNTDVRQVAISLGAALNGLSGEIYFSAPLWGDQPAEFDLAGVLESRFPSLRFTVVNDITAHLLWYTATQSRIGTGKTVLFTISTGIGCRTFDHSRQVVTLDSEYGIQGEVGHLPASVILQQSAIHAVCDCGAADHVSAFCSGSGVTKHWNRYQQLILKYYPRSELGNIESFNSEALLGLYESRDPGARQFMQLIVAPLGNLILTMLAVDPDIGEIALTGGFVQSLQPAYLDTLRGFLDSQGLYIISRFDPQRLARVVTLAEDSPTAGLEGAALYLKRIEGVS